jgi:hypothetical protein
MYLYSSYSGMSLISNLTQDILQKAYDTIGGQYIVRFYDGRFQYLVPHKWRDTGGWDNDSQWKESWRDIPIHKEQSDL